MIKLLQIVEALIDLGNSSLFSILFCFGCVHMLLFSLNIKVMVKQCIDNCIWYLHINSLNTFLLKIFVLNY